MCKWQSLKSEEKNPALFMISLKLCDEMELVLEFAFSTFRLKAITSTLCLKTRKFTTQYFTEKKMGLDAKIRMPRNVGNVYILCAKIQHEMEK